MSPYQEALAWIDRHPGTGSTISLVKLVLSLWNAECGFSFRECIHNLDADRTELALRRVTHFAARGEVAELVAAGHRLCGDYPHLWEIAEAGDAAKEKRRAALEAEAGAHERG